MNKNKSRIRELMALRIAADVVDSMNDEVGIKYIYLRFLIEFASCVNHKEPLRVLKEQYDECTEEDLRTNCIFVGVMYLTYCAAIDLDFDWDKEKSEFEEMFKTEVPSKFDEVVSKFRNEVSRLTGGE